MMYKDKKIIVVMPAYNAGWINRCVPNEAEKNQDGCTGHAASCYHKGIERNEIVTGETDRKDFLTRMGYLAVEIDNAIHAWALEVLGPKQEKGGN